MKKRLSFFNELVKSWADSIFLVVVVLVFLGAVVGVLLQYPIDASKLQDPAGESAGTIETTLWAHSPGSSADLSSGLQEEGALASDPDHGKN
jgi:hypothetical protein